MRAPDKTFAGDVRLMRKLASSFQPNNEQAARAVQAEGVPLPAPSAAEAFDDELRKALLLTTPSSGTNPVLAAAANADSLIRAIEQSGRFRTLTLPVRLGQSTFDARGPQTCAAGSAQEYTPTAADGVTDQPR